MLWTILVYQTVPVSHRMGIYLYTVWLLKLSMVQMVQTNGEHLLFKIILCEVTLVCLVFFSIFHVLKKKKQIFIQLALNLHIYVN